MLGDEKIFQQRHAGEQPHVLKRARDARFLGDTELGQALEQERSAIRMGEEQSADGRFVEAGNAVEQRGLAGAVRSDQRGDIPGARGETEVADGEEAAEAHGQMFDREDRRCRHAGLSVRASFTTAAGISLRRRSDTEGVRVATRPRGR